MNDDSRQIIGFDHVQVTAPRASEAEAKRFYGVVLGLIETPKPEALAGRGGAWYRCGSQYLHIGLEDDFQPQRKAHPAFLVRDLAAMRSRLETAGAPIAIDAQIPGYRRFETRDPFGNRIEFLQRVGTEDAGEGAAIKAKAREQFGRAAEAYVASPGHAAGNDLARLVELAAPRPSNSALDISAGGGHVALALAPHVARVIASDLTPAMLTAARRFLTERGASNVEYVVADAEQLPFLDASFDLVTVRIAPHHYADIHAAVREMARVLVPGGRLVVIDNIAPEDPALDVAMNDWEKRRDPSHVRAYTATEWRGFLEEAGLRVSHEEIDRKTHAFAPWAERMRMPEEQRAALEADILAAPEHVRAAFAVVDADDRVVSWSSDFIILRAEKPVSGPSRADD